MATPTPLRAPRSRPGFVLYVSLPEPDDDPAAPRTPTDPRDAARLAEAAEVLRELAVELFPTAETYTALALAPQPERALLRLLDGRPPHALPGSGDAG